MGHSQRGQDYRLFGKYILKTRILVRGNCNRKGGGGFPDPFLGLQGFALVYSLFMHMVQAFLSFQVFTRMTNQIWMFNELEVSFPWAPKWLSLDSRDWLAGDPNCTGTPYGDAVPDTAGPVPGAINLAALCT